MVKNLSAQLDALHVQLLALLASQGHLDVLLLDAQLGVAPHLPPMPPFEPFEPFESFEPFDRCRQPFEAPSHLQPPHVKWRKCLKWLRWRLKWLRAAIAPSTKSTENMLAIRPL